MDKNELEKIKTRLENKLIDLQSEYVELAEANKLDSNWAIDIHEAFRANQRRLKSINRRIELLRTTAEANKNHTKQYGSRWGHSRTDPIYKAQGNDNLIDDIITLVLGYTLIDGIFDPSGNAELSIDEPKRLKAELKKLLWS